MPKISVNNLIYLFLCGAIILFLLLQQLPLKINSVTFNGKKIDLPYNFTSHKLQTRVYSIDIEVNHFSSKFLKIVPDDCLEKILINNKEIPVFNIKGRCDWKHGFILDISRYIHKGSNNIKLFIKNSDSIGGLNIIPLQDKNSYIYKSLLFFTTFFLIVALYIFLKGIEKISNEYILLFIIGLLVRLIYLSYTSYDERTFDVVLHSGHLDYIKMIAEQHMLPNPTKGWEYHQPPLYYIIAAIFYKIADVTHLVNKLYFLQLFSLIIFFLFMVYSYKILNISIKNRYLLFYALMFVFFWPSGIIHSIRLGNDVLFYLLFAISFYYIILWRNKEAKIHLPLVFAGLSLITKSNGIILFGVIILLLIVDLVNKKDNFRKVIKEIALVGIYFIIAFCINFGDNIYFAIKENGQDWLVSNVINTINKKLFVTNQPYNYLYFDLKKYLSYPFIDAWHDQYGRQYFWNYLLKSSLFSEFFFHKKLQENIALIISGLSIPIFLYLLFAIITLKKAQIKNALPFLLVLVISILTLLAYRIKIPVACNTDFRYIFPILISMAYFYTLALDWGKKNDYIVFEWIGYIQIVTFSILSVIFYTFTIFTPFR